MYVVIVGQRNGTAPGVVRAYFGRNTSGRSLSDSQKSQSIENATYCRELGYSIHVNPSNNNTLEEFNSKLNLFVENGYYIVNCVTY